MVARHEEDKLPAPGLAGGVFTRWRHALDMLARRLMRAERPAIPGALALCAVLIGTTGAGYVMWSAAGPTAGIRAAVAIPLWAAVRLLVLGVVARNTEDLPDETLRHAWAWSLVPFAIAVTPLLDAVALLASAVVMSLVLEQRGVVRRRALILVAWVYGFQVLALLAAWLMRNLVLAGRVVLTG